jgi:hypothetical protein
MNIHRARLIIWNHLAYSRSLVREAAAYILGSLTASREDLDQAALVA